jgi:pilus assembly protein CpaB
MLASQAGVLRLAVRSADEKRLSRYWAAENDSAANISTANRELVQFNQLAMTPPPKPIISMAHPRRASPAWKLFAATKSLNRPPESSKDAF